MTVSKETTMIITKKMHLIVYGLGNEYKSNLWNPITNARWIKPHGGLWSSPVDSEFGWVDWAKDEHFGDLSTSFEIEYKGKTFVIDSLTDALEMPWVKCDSDYIGLSTHNLDFEKMVTQGIQAIHLTVNGQWATRHSQPVNLYGWDCECVLIMNKSCIRPVINKSLAIAK